MPDTETITAELTNDAFDIAFEAAAGIDIPPTEEALPETPPAEPEPPPVAETAPVVPETPPATSEPPQPDAEAIAAKAVADATAQAKADADAAAAKAKADADALAAKSKADEEAARVAERAAKEQFTSEELEQFEVLSKDFPETKTVIAAVQRVLETKFEARLEAELKKMTEQFQTQLAPVFATTQVVARNAHEAAILSKHADAFTVLPKVEEWIKSQPTIVQAAYNKVLDSGTSTEVVELLDVFKKEAGGAQPQPPTEPPKKDPEREERLNAQEGVRGRHTGGRAAVDPDDFDGAFDKFAAKA